MKRFLIFLFAVVSLQASAFGGKCGTFEATGVIRFENSQPKLVFNEGTTSAMILDLDSSSGLKPMHNGVAIQAEFKIAKSCGFRCKAQAFQKVRFLDPFEALPIYSVDMMGLKKKTDCQSE